jgi:hypothetical protein
MDYALTPNTTALLSYLSTNAEDSSFSFDDYPQTETKPTMLTSLPPSAFFNMARPDHTPELTPESSNTASESPEGLRVMATDSDEDGTHYRAPGGTERKGSDAAVVHKRKAGHAHTVQEEHDEDEDGMSCHLPRNLWADEQNLDLMILMDMRIRKHMRMIRLQEGQVRDRDDEVGGSRPAARGKKSARLQSARSR